MTKRDTFTVPEYFFTQRFYELVAHTTIDSYRARLHNPKTIFTELCEVLTDWHNKKIKSFETIKQVISEALNLLENENELYFIKTSKNTFKKILNDTKDSNYISLLYASQSLISENENYINTLFIKTQNEITHLNENHNKNADYFELNKLIGFLISEICSVGYSKSFLHHLVRSLFLKKTQYTFSESFQVFQDEVQKKELESFKVFFKAKLINAELESIKNRVTELLKEEDIKRLIEKYPKEFTNFYNEEKKNFPDIFCIDVKALDYYEAIKLARTRVSEILDFIKIGFNLNLFKIYKNAILYNENDPTKFEKQKIFYHIDGRLETSIELYDSFINKYLVTKENKQISQETKDKIKSAIRYYRIGSESLEIEQKFMNFWIGIEYLFSSYEISSSTFNRFKNNFSKIHSLNYLKRNLLEYKKDLDKLNFFEIEGYSELPDISELIDKSIYDKIIQRYHITEPLLVFRANYFYKILNENRAFSDYILNHKANLEAHLTRIYRIRNEIVHDAAIKPNIENLTANLRYYLIYTISELLNFFIDPPHEYNINGKIGIDDFFVFKELDFMNFEINKKEVEIQKTFFYNSKYFENIVY